MYWNVFVGFVFLIASLFNLADRLVLGLMLFSVGFAFIMFGFYQLHKDEQSSKEESFRCEFNQPPTPSTQQHQCEPAKTVTNSNSIPSAETTSGDLIPGKHVSAHHPTFPSSNYFLAYHYDDVKFYPPFDVVSKLNKNLLCPGANVILMPEPSNEYDNHAVALYVSGHKIGYLLRGTLQDMANDYIINKWPIKSTLSSLKFDGYEYQGYISLSFYRKVDESKPKLLGYHDIDIRSIHPTNPESQSSTPLTGKNIVFSGYFSMPINSAMQIAVDAGATLKSRVTKNVDYLVVGMQNRSFLDENGMSSKEATATRLIEQQGADIQIINEVTFLELAKTPSRRSST